jgi:hypothetical protein
MATIINDLQDTNVIQQQINYIKDLKTYIDYLNQGITNKCITVSSSTILGNASTLNCAGNASLSSLCNPICGNITTYYDKIKNGDFSIYRGNTSLTDSTLYGNIIENNKKIQDLRNELDLKLKDINRTSDSRFQNYEDKYNYEVMMNITLSILATSIIYYVFVKF